MPDHHRPRRQDRRALFLALLLACGLVLPAAALPPALEGGAPVANGEEPVRAELLLDRQGLAPGDTTWAGILLVQDEGWHTYWKYSGDSGLPTVIDWELPEGVRAGDIHWPAPHRYVEAGDLTTYGYEGEIALLVPLVADADLATGTELELVARVDWLMCRELCIPGGDTLSASVPVTARPAAAPDADLAHIRAARARLPLPAAQLPGLSAEGWLDLNAYPPGQRGHWLLAFDGVPEGTPWMWLPAPGEFLYEETPQARHEGDRLELLVPFEVDPGAEVGALLPFEGVLELGEGDAQRWASVATEVAVAGPGETIESTGTERFAPWLGEGTGTIPADPDEAGGGGGILYYLLLAFVGGIILNIMPCVLPVLSLKVMGFVRHANESRRKQLQLGLVFMAGVLASFLALAAVVVGLQAAGDQLGWGFQFQNPMFVVAMCTLVFAFGLSLFGVYEIVLPLGGAGAGGGGAYGESFLNGILATALATPCTAPFLGTALGFAFTQPAWVITAIFVAIALGLSAPYVLLSANPAWLRFVPRPGPWMETFKQAMGFLLMGTLVWLLWVLGQQLGADAVVWTLAFLTCLGFALWLWGRLVDFSSSQARRSVVLAVVFLVVAGSAWGFLRGPLTTDPATLAAGPSAGTHEGPGGMEWVEFTPERLRAEVEAGRTVFLDFTAAWCWTCKVNERTVIAREGVVSKIRELGVVPMVGDWTRRDPAITALLREHGRSGVPFYAVYPAGRYDDPIVLPEVITEGIVVGALERAGPSRGMALAPGAAGAVD